jgi:hypothetical protein
MKSSRQVIAKDGYAGLCVGTTARSGGTWSGVIRQGRTVIWTCPHRHINRDIETAFNAARPCATAVLEAIHEPEAAQRMIAALGRSIPNFQSPQQKQQWEVRHREWQEAFERRRWALGVADALRMDKQQLTQQSTQLGGKGN